MISGDRLSIRHSGGFDVRRSQGIQQYGSARGVRLKFDPSLGCGRRRSLPIASGYEIHSIDLRQTSPRSPGVRKSWRKRLIGSFYTPWLRLVVEGLNQIAPPRCAGSSTARDLRAALRSTLSIFEKRTRHHPPPYLRGPSAASSGKTPAEVRVAMTNN